jgi:3-hydroxymyristoyl/3-hydroxydecanoyl-(acyl carrier protein) dehydratase
VTDSSPAPPAIITAECVVPIDSLWFSGHFPGNPILPGVAQLEMAATTIARSYGKNLYVARLSRVKFKSLAHPGEALLIEAWPGAEAGAFTFSIRAGEREVCRGNMILSEKNGENT